MATTIGRISEQIQRIINGGDPSSDNQIQLQEIKLLVGQVCNKLLKLERFATNMPEGDYGVPQAMIATYDNIPVTAYKDRAKSVLPTTPISLPRNMGVWAISTTSDPDNMFIPIPSGTFGLLKKIDVERDMFGQIAYEVEGMNVVYSKDIRNAPLSINAVTIKLLVIDPSVMGDYDILPIPADMEPEVIAQTLQMLSAYQPKDNSVDGNNKV
jgi:hypothetical protein